MDIDLSNFEKEDFSIDGFYRAIVEDNVDPLESGRLRVRILGIHSMDASITPTENLPWAEPAVPISHSGGANLQNINPNPGVPVPPLTRYQPLPVVAPLATQLPVPVATETVNQATTEFTTITEHRDTALCNSGSGGHFTTPAKGSLVWIFFDGGSHLRPQYFAMATQARDWEAQKLKLVGELNDRDTLITTLLSKLEAIKDKTEHSFTGTATSGKSKVATSITVPKHTPIGTTFSLTNRMENLSSWTSPGGTTILVNHTFGKEQLYIIHKGYSHFVDSNGQVVKIVGATSPTPTSQVTAINPQNSSGLANDEKEINAGLKEIFVIGDYKLLTMGNCFIECNQSVQINANANVGLVSRTGNINLLAETSNINIESTKGSINFKAKDMQFESIENIVFKCNKDFDIKSELNFKVKTNKAINFESASILSKAISDFSVETDAEINLVTKGQFKSSAITSTTIDSASISVNGSGNILLNSALVELNGSAGINLQSAGVNIKGISVNVNGEGVVNVLGASLNVFGTGTAMIGGAVATVGGAATTLTGIVTMGIGTVTPASPANPVSNQYTPPQIKPIEPYVETPFIPSVPDVPVIPTPSQVVT